MVVFHRMCLRPVCLGSDDAKLMDILYISRNHRSFIYPTTRACRRAVLQFLPVIVKRLVYHSHRSNIL